MSYPDDPKANRRQSYPMTDDRNYTGWIVGGILAFAVLCGLFFTFGSKTDQHTAVNEPTTTGSTTSDIPKAPATSVVPAKPRAAPLTAPR